MLQEGLQAVLLPKQLYRPVKLSWCMDLHGDEERTCLWGGQVLFSRSKRQLSLALADWQGRLGLVPVPEQVPAGIGGQPARLEVWRHVPRHPAERLRPYLRRATAVSGVSKHRKGGTGS